jgi:hypothetical protein
VDFAANMHENSSRGLFIPIESFPDYPLGRLTDDRIASIKWGWDYLFAKSLTAYAETRRSK